MLQTPNSPNLVLQIAKKKNRNQKRELNSKENLMPHGTESLLIAS